MSSGQTQRTAASWLPGSARQQGLWSVALGAGIWGLFWLPLRYLDSEGITGLWSVALVMFFVIFPPLALLLINSKLEKLKSKDAWFIGGAFAASIVLYFTGVIFSDVIRVIFLFYLLPVWTTIAARVIHKEPIPLTRLIAIVTALVGLWLLLGGGNNFPIPKNLGDWCGLLAGVCWGVSLAFIRDKEDVDALALVCSTAVCATVIAVGVAVLLLFVGSPHYGSLPSTGSLSLVLITIVFSFFLLYPSLIAQLWGAQRIPSPTAALLMMSEIIAATVSAYLIIGTELNGVSILGALIILIAVIVDVFYDIVNSNE